MQQDTTNVFMYDLSPNSDYKLAKYSPHFTDEKTSSRGPVAWPWSQSRHSIGAKPE